MIDQKGVQTFFGNINFIQILTHNYASISKPINKLLNKDQVLNGLLKLKEHLQILTQVTIVSSLVLVNPNFEKHFILYSFSYEYSIEAFLTQNN